MSAWRRCETCRKVRSSTEFEGDAGVCQVCLTVPEPVVRKRAAPVVRSQSTPRAAPAQTGPPAQAVRRSPTGSVGSGDLEVRERRARRAALEELALSHPDEVALLLRDARQAEGLRPLSSGAPSPAVGGGE